MKQTNMQSRGPIPSAEERIIQYMDGELNDSDSAELLHRASVSPEIRQLLADHEQLAQLSQRAMLGAAIPAALEERVLAQVGQLAAANRTASAAFWNQSWIKYSAAALLLGGVLLSAFLLRPSDSAVPAKHNLAEQAPSQTPSSLFSFGNQAVVSAQGAGDIKVESRLLADEQHAPRAIANIRGAANNATHASSAARSYTSLQHSVPSKHTTVSAINRESKSLTDVAGMTPAAVNSSAVNSASVNSGNIATPAPLSTPTSVAASDEATVAQIGFVQNRNAVTSVAQLQREDSRNLAHVHPIQFDQPAGITNFELGLQTSSGFSYPASGPNVHPFADFRANLTYFLDDQNVVGFRLTSGLFQTSPGIVRTVTSSATIVHDEVTEQRELAEELYYGHRFLLSAQSGLALETALGAGLIPQGNTIALELGFKLPFGDHFMGTAGFSLMRIHSTAPLMRDVIANELSNSGSTPVVFEGSDIRNTLNGRIEYGFAYRF